MCVILLVILIIVLLFSCAFMQDQTESEYEKNVNQITEIDYSKQQEELEAIVEKGKMNVNYSSRAVFHGKISESFRVKNIKNNHYPIVFEILDEDGECIYLSKKIEPGYEMTQIELEKELSTGKHECQLKIGYAEEGNVSSVFPLTIEVR